MPSPQLIGLHVPSYVRLLHFNNTYFVFFHKISRVCSHEKKHSSVYIKNAPATTATRLTKGIPGVGSPRTPDRASLTSRMKAESTKKTHLAQTRKPVSLNTYFHNSVMFL